MSKEKRIEKDILGELGVPADVYWGINTQRTLNNFQISGKQFPLSFIVSLAKVKKAALLANAELGLIDTKKSQAILKALDEIIEEGKLHDQFPVDVFQTGSGTQINMNMNEVLANRSNELLGESLGKKTPIHPNDHINKGQSSNDVIPTTMHLVTIMSLKHNLLPVLHSVLETLENKITEFRNISKVGRTHLQDAVPIPLSVEFSVYKQQIQTSIERLEMISGKLKFIPLGGTAVGTGTNTHKDFSQKAISHLSKITDTDFKSSKIKAEAIASHSTFVRVSNELKTLALSLIKLANDIRWMGSGPRAGLGELKLPHNEPGSSIMPGKVNPSQSEMLLQVCIHVIGNDTAVSYAEAIGSTLDLNITKPLIIDSILESIRLMTNGLKSFNLNCLVDLEANLINIQKQLQSNLMIVTKIAPDIGYDAASEIAKKAHEEDKTIIEVLEESDLENKDSLIEKLCSEDDE
ncbi:MAG: class II fumarate hydratase [Candidatus Heimdallarchaeaceae archaeon]